MEGCRRNQGVQAVSRRRYGDLHAPENATASGLSNIFPTKDGKRFVKLPHRVLSVDRDQLRAEVEARWRAFGKRTDTGARRP
jgi:hypothetical protein